MAASISADRVRIEGRGRRRVWAETLSHEAIGDPQVMGLLRRYSLEVLVAVRPGESGSLSRLLKEAEASGIRAGIWPMLDDRDGRWASARNAERFASFVETLLDELADHGIKPAELALDLEPPIQLVEVLIGGGRGHGHGHVRGNGHGNGHGHGRGYKAIERLIETMRARGIDVSAAVVPLVLLDPPSDHPGLWQSILGTPIPGAALAHISPMLYTSMIEGASRGVVDRRSAEALLAAGCAEARARWGDRAGASLGAVSTGALGDEPTYRDPNELADDVSIAIASGVTDLTLFDLGGVLRRPPAEAWLDAFIDDPRDRGSPPRRPPRAGSAIRAALFAARAASLVSSLLAPKS